MPSKFNDAARLVIDRWRRDLTDENLTDEEVLEHVYTTVLPDEVEADRAELHRLGEPSDQVVEALHDLYDGPFVPSFGSLTYLPSWQELADIAQLVRLPNESEPAARTDQRAQLTLLQRYWIYLARRGELPERAGRREQRS